MPPRDHGPSDSGVGRPVPVSPSSQSRRSVIPVVPGRVLDQELPARSFQRLPLGTREPVTLHPHPSRCCQPPSPAPVRGHAPARPGRSHSQRTRVCPPVRSAAWLHNHAGECAHLPPMRARRRRHAEPAHLRMLGFRIEPSLTPADQKIRTSRSVAATSAVHWLAVMCAAADPQPCRGLLSCQAATPAGPGWRLDAGSLNQQPGRPPPEHLHTASRSLATPPREIRRSALPSARCRSRHWLSRSG